MTENTNNTTQAFWLAMGTFSSMALGIVSTMILSRYFSKVDYGTYRQIVFVYTTLLIVFSAGLPRVFSYFLPRYSIEEGKTIVKKINRVLFLAGLIFSVCLYCFAGSISGLLKNPELVYGLKVFSPIPLLLLPTLGMEGIFATYKKTIYIAIYSTISRLLTLIFIIGPVILFKGDYISAIYGWILASLLSIIMAYFFMRIPFKQVNPVQTSLQYKEIFTYSIPLVVASLWGVAINSANQFYISRYFGVEVFAEFSNGFIELPFVSMITSSAAVVLMPAFSKVFFENKGIDDLLKVWRRTLYKSSIIIYPMLIFTIVFASEVMILIYSEKYEQSAVYFRINMFLNFFNIIIFAPLFLAMGRTKLYANVHMILAFVIWSSDFFLIQIFNSPLLIAYNSTFLNIIKIFVFIYLASRILKIKFIDFFPIKDLLAIILHGILTVTVIKIFQDFLFSSLSLFLQILLCSMLYGILLLGTGRIFKINYLNVLDPLIGRFKNRKKDN